MASRVIYRFQQGVRGWTEVFYSASDPASAVGLPETSPWTAVRLSLLVPSAKLLTVTAVSLTGFRVAAVRAINANGGRSPFSTAEPDYTEVAAFYRFTSDRHTRGYWMRGLSEEDTELDVQTGDWTVKGSILSRFQEMEGVTKNRYSTYGYDSLTNQPWKQVIEARGTTNGYTEIAVPVGTALPAANSLIYFKGLNPFMKCILMGTFRVLSVNEPSRVFVVQAPWPNGLDAQPLIQPASYRSAEKVISAITSGSYLRVSDHDTGRPTNLPRGRSRGHRTRRSIPAAVSSVS